MKMKIVLITCFIQIFFNYSWANDKKKEGKNIIYKYKKYESFDLGDMEIKGNIIAPGDLSVKERNRKKFNRILLDKETFDNESLEDIRNIR